MPKLSEMLFGKKSETQQISALTPEQQAYQNALLESLGITSQEGLSFLSDLLGADSEGVSALQQPYLTEFYQETIPSLAERFTQLGGQSSSAFNQAAAKAGANLMENLASQRIGAGIQGLSQLGQFQSPAMASSFGYETTPGTTGIAGDIASGLIGGGLGGFGKVFGKSAGTALGNKLFG